MSDAFVNWVKAFYENFKAVTVDSGVDFGFSMCTSRFEASKMVDFSRL